MLGFCMKFIKKIKYFFRRPALVLIEFYQKFFSPDHSFWAKRVFPLGYCRFYPTCSEYGKLAIKKYGLIIGTVKIIWRILRCNPWSKGGIDSV